MSSNGPAWPATVLHVTPAVPSDGTARSVVDAVEALVQAGAAAVVASSGGAAVREIERAGGAHVELPLASTNPLTMRRNAEALAALAGERDARLVHVHRRLPAWSAREAAARNGAFFVASVHRAYSDLGFVARRLTGAVYKADRLIAPSSFVRDHVVATTRIDPSRIRVIRPGLDIERFHPGGVTGARVVQAAQNLNLPEAKRVILVPLRLNRNQGVTAFLDAIKVLGRDDIVCLFMQGDDEIDADRRDIAALIANRGLDGIVRFVGTVADPTAAYMLADVVALPTMGTAAAARVAIEAQGMGRPVVAVDEEGAGETMVPGVSGWVVPAGDVRALAGALDAALALDPARREVLRDAAASHVRARFDRRVNAAFLLAVYRELLMGRPLWAE